MSRQSGVIAAWIITESCCGPGGAAGVEDRCLAHLVTNGDPPVGSLL